MPMIDRAVVLARGMRSESTRGRGWRGDLCSLPRECCKDARGATPVQIRHSAAATVVICCDRWTEWYYPASIATFWAIEERGPFCSFWWPPWKGFATAWGLAVRVNSNAINGRVETAVDRWHSHLLVPVLVLLHLLSYQTLRKCPARARGRASLLHALSPPRLTRDDP